MSPAPPAAKRLLRGLTAAALAAFLFVPAAAQEPLSSDPVPVPVFARLGEQVTLAAPPSPGAGEAVLRSRRLGLSFKVPVSSPRGRPVLDLGRGLPPDEFDLAAPPGRPAPGAVRLLRGAGEALRVAHITDIHYDENASKDVLLARFLKTAALLDPDLVVCTGDIMSNPTAKGYAAVREMLDRLTVPVVFCPGNHDHRNLKLWRERFSDKTYQSFDAGPFHIVLLDTGKADNIVSRGGEGIEDDQLAWLRRDLKAAAGKAVYIFMHHSPVMEGESFDDGRVEFLDLVRAAGVKGIFAGHIHRDAAFDLGRGGRPVTSLAGTVLPVIHTTTLASSRLKGSYHGFRLLLLTPAGLDPDTPYASLPDGALDLECLKTADRQTECRLVNAATAVVKGVRLDYDGAGPGKGVPWAGLPLWSGGEDGRRMSSWTINLPPGASPLPRGFTPRP